MTRHQPSDRPAATPVPHRTTRRRVLRGLAATAGLGTLAAAGGAGYLGWLYLDAAVDTVGQVDFDRPLAIPPLADSAVLDGVRTFDLTLRGGSADLGRGVRTPTWGVNGPHLGPTLRARRGEQVRVRVTNDLDEATTLHWHGMHLPAEMDGGPHQMIEPGVTWTPRWLVDQPAASLWYHPHPHGATAAHVYRGVAGMFLLDDDEEAALALPRTYGVDDVPLIVADRRFRDDGTLEESGSLLQSAGVTGDVVLVNGTPGAYLEVTTRTLRLRILNASNTRPYRFALEDERELALVATDGGLLEAPVPVRAIQLSPGERAEVVVTLEPGDRVRLQSGPSATADRLAGGADHLDVLQLRAADVLGGLERVPDRLVAVERLDAAAADVRRDVELSGFSVNGRQMDMARVDEVVTLGSTEVWTVTNLDGATHNFHVHDVQFQVVDVDGREPPAYLRGWKDTVWLRPREAVRIVMRFTDHASTEWPYMYHCHVLRHEDLGLMGQFLVVEPGASTRPEDYRIAGAHAH